MKGSGAGIPLSQRRQIRPFTMSIEGSMSPTTVKRRVARERKTTEIPYEEPDTVKNTRALFLWKIARKRLRGPIYLFKLCKELRLYGTSSALKDQENRYKKNVKMFLQRLKTVQKYENRDKLWFILLPQSLIRRGWNLVLLLLLCYTATVMPFRIAFDSSIHYDVWYWIEIGIDCLFILDLLINFITAFEKDDGVMVVSWTRITTNYLRGWFVIDLVTSFPFTAIDNIDNTGNQSYSQSYKNLIRLVRLPRLYRLVRITRLLKVIKQLKDSSFVERVQDFLQLNASVMRILSFATTVMLLVHIIGCLWFFIADIEDLGPDTWVSKVGLLDQPNLSQYIASVYWAFTTLATIGYGDISANTDIERVFSIAWMLFGIGFYSFTIGSLTSILSDLDSRNNDLTVKLNAVDQLSKEAKLCTGLKLRLRKAVRLHAKKTELDSGDKQQMFDSLPKKLRYQVAMSMYDQAAHRIPFFQKRSPEFISTIIPYLRYLFVEADEFVYRKMDDSDEVYFILNGRVAFVTGFLLTVFKTMLEGSYFGDVELLLKEKRLCSTRVECDTELLVMPKPVATIQMVRYIAEEFPEVFREMAELGEKRRNKILDTKSEVDEAMEELDQEAEWESLRTNRRNRISAKISDFWYRC